MNYKQFLLLFLLSINLPLISQDQKSLELTIYNNNFGLIRDIREYNLEKGINNIKLIGVPPTILQNSIYAKLDGQILEQSYRYDIADNKMFYNRILNAKITLVNSKSEKMDGEFISVNNPFIFKSDNGQIIAIPSIDDYSILSNNLINDLIIKPSILWRLNSNKSGKQDIAVNYLFSNITWNCDYTGMVAVNDSTIDLDAMFTLQNTTGYSFKNIDVNLLSGDINISRNSYSNSFRGGSEILVSSFAEDIIDFKDSKVSDYVVFQINDKINLEDNESKQIKMFSQKNIKIKRIKRIYTYLGAFVGKFDNYIILKNDTISGLGKILPQGKIRFYKNLNEKPEFLGESSIDLTNPGEEIEFRIGEVPGVSINQIVMNENVQTKTRITDFESKVYNRTDKNEDVEILIRIDGSNMKKSDVKFEKVNANLYKYVLNIKKNSEFVFKYSVETVIQ